MNSVEHETVGPEELKAELRGTHRVRPLEVTWQLIQSYFAAAGITRVADISGLDFVGIPTVTVVRPNSRSLSVSQGKGLTLDAAKVSGVMEALEHFHAESTDLPLRLVRIEELLARGEACDLERLPAFPRVSGELTADTRILWAPADELNSGRALWVPFEMVHLDLTLPLPSGSGYFPVSSNGLASGNSVLEATVHALCELIERDARTLFLLRSPLVQSRQRVRPESVTDAGCRELLERFHAQDVSVAIWDMTSDLGVACFLAGVLEREDNVFRRVPFALGSGCHLDAGVALSRALTEAAQTRLTNISGARDDTLPEVLLHARREDAQRQARAVLLSGPAEASFGEVATRANLSIQADLTLLLEQLSVAGLGQVLRTDLSKPGWPISVVRMVVPGLEFLSELPGYVPGERALRLLQEAT